MSQYWEPEDEAVDAEPRRGRWQRALPAHGAADQGAGAAGRAVRAALLPWREPQPARGLKVVHISM